VKNAVQAVEGYFPEVLRETGQTLLGSCYDDIFVKANMSSLCLKLALSKFLGIGIVAVSSIVKVPQLLKIIKAKSAEGISLESFALEAIAYSIALAYNMRMLNPFSTYGETALMLIQDIAIIGAIVFYSGEIRKGGILAGLYVGLLGVLYSVSNSQLRVFQMATIPLSLTSKVPQMYTNYISKSTGQLAAFGVFNAVIGALVRVFTTFQEVNDPIILSGYILSAVFNGVLALQMVAYWNNTSSSVTSKEK
ncbi:hypothetical protein CANCADRAFT_13252, partial [Tortispora caseinolytica NRRL Y-17796]